MKGEKDFPDSYSINQVQAVISLVKGDTLEAKQYIGKSIFNLKSKSYSEAFIMTSLAQRIYSEANFLDSAEVYYQKALTLEPDSVKWMNNLAYFLIDKDQDIIKGLALADKALELSPDNYESLHCKGWGFYKQGKFQEAKEMLQKSWDLRMNNAFYNYDAELHLEKAKKDAASQK